MFSFIFTLLIYLSKPVKHIHRNFLNATQNTFYTYKEVKKKESYKLSFHCKLKENYSFGNSSVVPSFQLIS